MLKVNIFLCYNYTSGSGSWYGDFVGETRDIFYNTNLTNGRDPNLMAMIMFKTGVDVPSKEGMWRL